MGVPGRTLFVLWALLLMGLCWCDDHHLSDRSVVLIGRAGCADCALQKIKLHDAFSGLHVAIDCKAANSNFRTRGIAELDKEGNFKVELPNELVNDDGELTQECYAQLHSAARNPCPAQNGLAPLKIVIKNKNKGKHTLGTAGKLSFTPATCTSKFLWPFFKYPPLPKLPPLSKGFPWFKPLPPAPLFKKPPFPKFPPVYKKPLPPMPKFPPVYKKPLPPFRKSPPIHRKPMPPPLMPKFPPIYKKPLPPFPKFPPFFKKPLPPLPKFPPFFGKPLPPLPKLPPLPPLPKFPPLPRLPALPPIP